MGDVCAGTQPRYVNGHRLKPQPSTFNLQPIPAYSDLLGPIPDPLPPTPAYSTFRVQRLIFSAFIFSVPYSAFHVQIPYYPCTSACHVYHVPRGSIWFHLVAKSTPQCQKTGPTPTDAGQKMKSPVDLGYEETAVPHSGPPPLRNILSGNILVTNA